MATFKAFASSVIVNGETVLSVVDGLEAYKTRALKLLENNGIKDPRPGQWYRQQDWLNAFKEISETIGLKTLAIIGGKIPENAKFPPEIDSIEKALAAIDVAYHMNHKGGEIGHYTFTSTGPNSAILVCNNPYHCEFDRGIIEAMARRFQPKGISPKVVHDDTCECRQKGGESCTYKVSWK